MTAIVLNHDLAPFNSPSGGKAPSLVERAGGEVRMGLRNKPAMTAIVLNQDFNKIKKMNLISNPLCSLCILSVPCGKRFKPQSSQRFYTKFTNNNCLNHDFNKIFRINRINNVKNNLDNLINLEKIMVQTRKIMVQTKSSDK